MAVDVRLVVTDAPPLITLAVAKSLDYLLYPELPVLIPDAVFHEATAAAGKLGAQEILDWYRTHMAAVRISSELHLPSDRCDAAAARLSGAGGWHRSGLCAYTPSA